MDSALLSALQGIAPRLVTLVKLKLPDADVLWCDGGFVVWGADTYAAEHEDYGVISTLSPIRDGSDGQATRVEMEVLPATDAGVAGLISADAQGSPMTWWEGSVDPVSGLLTGEPTLKFCGEYDRPRLSVGTSRGFVLEFGTEAERQLEPNEEWRLNDAHQQSVWPGDLGCLHVTDNPKKIWWRAVQRGVGGGSTPWVGGGGGGTFTGGGFSGGTFGNVTILPAPPPPPPTGTIVR